MYSRRSRSRFIRPRNSLRCPGASSCRSSVSKPSRNDASGVFSSWVTASRKALCDWFSRISRTSFTQSQTSPANTKRKKADPNTKSIVSKLDIPTDGSVSSRQTKICQPTASASTNTIDTIPMASGPPIDRRCMILLPCGIRSARGVCRGSPSRSACWTHLVFEQAEERAFKPIPRDRDSGSGTGPRRKSRRSRPRSSQSLRLKIERYSLATQSKNRFPCSNLP